MFKEVEKAFEQMGCWASSKGIPFHSFANTYNVEKLENLGSIKGYEDVILEVLQALPKSHQILDSHIGSINDERKLRALKNSTKATELRDKGNKLYTKSKSTEDFIKVFRAYNESVAFAPNNSQELALAYGNRAMILFRLKYFNECLSDINRALRLDYPDKSVGKLLIKKVRCMKILNHPDLLVTYNECLKTLDKHSKNIPEMRRDLRQAYEEKVTDPCLTPVNTKLRDDLLEHLKKLCPNLEKVEIKINEGKLALVAARDIRVNEVIAIQKMYANILHIEEPYLACWQCVVMCLNPIPCDGCSVATFCSESCKAEAWNKHHQYECQVMHVIQKAIPDYLLPIRICMRSMKQLGGILPLMKEVYKMSKATDIKQEHHIVNGAYASDSYRSVYYMINRVPVATIGYGMPVLNVSSFVSYLATETTFFGQQYKGDVHTLMQERPLKFFAALILRHFVMLREMQKDEWSVTNDILMSSSPVCPLFHNLDHSCNPNSVKVSLKDHQILVAIDAIKKGEEINVSFYPEILLGLDKAERMSIISGFSEDECKCQVCVQKGPQKPIAYTKKNERKLVDMYILHREMTMAIIEYRHRKPKTAAEFVKRTATFYEKFGRPFSALAPSLCDNIVSHKNYLMTIYLQLPSDIINFMDTQSLD